jgi:hypothetical protein
MSHGSFSGEPSTRWLTEEPPDRKMELLEDFSFTDPAGKIWSAPAGYKVDGASIPRPLWSLVGSPYTGDYRRASIVHDKACDDAHGNVTARREADRMFFHACRVGGCTRREAIILYLGVRLGASGDSVPAWRMGLEAAAAAGPRYSTPAAERRVEADFRLAAELILQLPETDDPTELEARTDAVLSQISASSLPGQ